jgi:hypothetical protein
MHYDAEGRIFLPPNILKNTLSNSGTFLGMQIPNKNRATYTKHIQSGIMVTEPIFLYGPHLFGAAVRRG